MIVKNPTQMLLDHRRIRSGLSLTELLLAIALLAIVAAAALARYGSYAPEARKHACEVYKGNIEVQCQLWYRNKGALPAANLSDIGADITYFPEGLPQCPVDGSAFALDPATQKITGHPH